MLKIICLTIALAQLSCSGHKYGQYLSAVEVKKARAELDTFKQQLHLTAFLSKSEIREGEELSLHFILENVGTEKVRACVGIMGTYMILGKQTNAILPSRIVDHPFCEMHLNLKPKETFDWQRSFTTPSIGVGPAKLTATVQLVHPSYCDTGGCYDTMLKLADPVEFVLIE